MGTAVPWPTWSRGGLGGQVFSGRVDGERWLFNVLPGGREVCVANPGIPLPPRRRPVRVLSNLRFERFVRKLSRC
mgnify:CR=1 FL=1